MTFPTRMVQFSVLHRHFFHFPFFQDSIVPRLLQILQFSKTLGGIFQNPVRTQTLGWIFKTLSVVFLPPPPRHWVHNIASGRKTRDFFCGVVSTGSGSVLILTKLKILCFLSESYMVFHFYSSKCFGFYYIKLFQ